MDNRFNYLTLIPVYAVVISFFLLFGFGTSRAVTVFRENAPYESRKSVIIDAGHGGVDGGATSCTGVLESKINLDIALKLEDLCHLLGIETIMIRRTDCSVYTAGESISQKKISDLKERVRIVNQTDDALLVSIHQNHFVQSQYFGAQVFYPNDDRSRELARTLQTAFTSTINPTSKRKAKKADGVYLMDKINRTAVLVECGFLSNPEEEAALRTESYQQKICAVIATTVSQFLTKNR